MRTGSGVRCATSVVQVLRVTSIFFDWRPPWAHWQCRRREGREFCVGVNDLPADDGEHRFQMLDLFFRNRKIVGREDSEVSQLASGEGPLFSVFRRKPTAAHRVELECFLPVQSVLFRIKTENASTLACD